MPTKKAHEKRNNEQAERAGAEIFSRHAAREFATEVREMARKILERPANSPGERETIRRAIEQEVPGLVDKRITGVHQRLTAMANEILKKETKHLSRD